MAARIALVTDAPTLEDYKTHSMWLAWQAERLGDNLTKVPYSPVNWDWHGKSNDPKTWGTWREACARAKHLPKLEGGGGGIGIVLGHDGKEGVGGIDLDSCFDAKTGELKEWAAEVIERFNSYCELSPSGTGVHLLFRYAVSDLPRLALLIPNYGRELGSGKHTGIAPYLSNKYFTVTEDHFEDTPDTLRLMSVEDIEWLVAAGEAQKAQNQGSNGNKAHKGGGTRRGLDYTASGIADKMALQLRRAGCTYDQMVQKLQEESATREWVTTKGELRNQRELKRIWERAGNTIETEANAPEIAKMNEEFAVVLVGGSAAVLREYVDSDGQPKIDLLSPQAFLTWTQNQYITVRDRDKDQDKAVALGKYWLGHSQRRQYHGLVFEPNREIPGHYNLWKGFSVKPIKGNYSCDLFLDHILVNVCRGNTELFNWVLGWMAQMVQRPQEKIGTALVLKGEMGTGKTVVAKTLGSLFRNHYVKISDPQYITGLHNKYLHDCLLLHLEEGFWAGNHAAEAKLKDLITSDDILIRQMYLDAFKAKNYTRVLVSGNPDWVVPAGLQERRFAVLEMGEEHREDKPYFAAIEKQLDEGGREALLHYLLNFDLSQVDLRTIPQTAALLEQKLQSLHSNNAWWLDVLMSGRLPGRQGHMVSKKALFDHYEAHARKIGFGRKSIETALGMFLNKMVRGLRTYEDQQFTDDEGRVYFGNAWSFPTLDTCRKQFCQKLGQKMPQWVGSDAEWR